MSDSFDTRAESIVRKCVSQENDQRKAEFGRDFRAAGIPKRLRERLEHEIAGALRMMVEDGIYIAKNPDKVAAAIKQMTEVLGR